MAPPGRSDPAAADVPQAPPPAERPERSRAVLFGVAALILGAVMLLTGVTGESEPVEIAPVSVDGEALAPLHRLDDGDPSLGQVAPEIRGVGHDGRSAALAPGDGPTAVIFVAHWCPYCQEEVPAVQGLIDDEGLPNEVDVFMVVTDTTEQRENYPPSDWLERVGWSPRVIMDDGTGTAAEAYGVNGFPFHVFLDGEGRVLGRISGAVGAESYQEILRELATR
jgi:cytochrome c biogenesis protein CcmG, thiol:disulfide interchange protein DsbE